MVIGYDHMKYPKQGPAHYNVAEAKAHFSTLVRKALQGEEVVIARDNKPLLRLVPVGVPSRAPGSAKGRVAMADDFDASLEDFADYER
jgi:prevent-host-death family protein